jgi:dihydrofolate synthase/folylpolyglutamate synthase
MRALCRGLGEPQRGFRSLLVTGTNGKGSICAMLYAMLQQSPIRVGLYTSPHLEHVRERIRTWSSGPASAEPAHGGDWIGEAEFAGIVERLQPLIEELRAGPEGAPTYFEALTAVAFEHFRRRRIEVAVLEVGLGGRLDATNVVHQAVSVFGPIDVDHADVLGADPAAIAQEKAGIIKPGQLAVSVAQEEPVGSVLRSACDGQGVPLFVCGRDITASVHQHDLDGLEVSISGLRGTYANLRIPMIGGHQAQNAAAAVAALEALSAHGIPHTLVERGLSQVAWPGRIEVVNDAPLILMDGAHNRQAAEALALAVGELCPGRRIHLLVGMSADKPVEEVGMVLGRAAVSTTCTRSTHPRALEPAELARRLAAFCPDVHVMPDAADAYTYLLNAVSAEDVILVTGSLFLVGELRARLRQSPHIRPRRRRQLAAESA